MREFDIRRKIVYINIFYLNTNYKSQSDIKKKHMLLSIRALCVLKFTAMKGQFLFYKVSNLLTFKVESLKYTDELSQFDARTDKHVFELLP